MFYLIAAGILLLILVVAGIVIYCMCFGAADEDTENQSQPKDEQPELVEQPTSTIAQETGDDVEAGQQVEGKEQVPEIEEASTHEKEAAAPTPESTTGEQPEASAPPKRCEEPFTTAATIEEPGAEPSDEAPVVHI